MSRKIIVVFGIIFSTILILACGGTTLPLSDKQSVDAVETMVQSTLQALVQNPGGVTPQPGSSNPSDLPHTLYYLADDSGGNTQVFRLERDGLTVSQVTHEVVDIEDYSVASDGRIVYVANNQLLFENMDGSGRLILLDGGIQDPNARFLNSVSSPVWSPDGQTVAFGFQGLNLYNVTSGTVTNVVPNVIENIGTLTIPRELFSPRGYSPDGSSLMINIGWYEGGTFGIYRVASNTLVRPSMQGILCCSTIWASDSSAFYFASSSMGMIDSGLWRFDLNGTVTTLLPGQAGDGTFNYADVPLLAPDGKLYFFFANRPDIPSGFTPMMLVKAAPDAVTDRTLVLPDTFTMLIEALWASDASLVVIVQAPNETTWRGGQLTAIYADGRPSRPLANFGYSLKWGP